VNDELLTALRKLDSIGGEVSEEEIAYHLGPDAVFALLDAEGLVTTRTTFELTTAGREALNPPSPDPRVLTCRDCGATFLRRHRRGRPPLLCEDCRPFDRRRVALTGGDST
jgi:hypothetical protein